MDVFLWSMVLQGSVSLAAIQAPSDMMESSSLAAVFLSLLPTDLNTCSQSAK